MTFGHAHAALRAALAAATLALLPHIAHAQDKPVELFVDAPAQADRAGPPRTQGAVRERMVTLNPAAFSGVATDRAAADKASDGARTSEASPLKSEFQITLFKGASATFRVETVEKNAEGTTLQASAGGRDQATLVVADGKITGRVIVNKKTYQIRPADGGQHKIAELSRELLPPDAPHLLSEASKKSKKSKKHAKKGHKHSGGGDQPSASASDDDITEIDVLYVYTGRAQEASSDIAAELRLANDITNKSFADSQVKIRYRSVGVVKVDYDENLTSYNDVLTDATGTPNASNAGAFGAVRAKRDELGADLVVVVREAGGYCGVGWINTPPEGAEAFGYAEVSRGCIEYNAVAHETGHNMGLHHDRYVESPAGNDVYNYGFVNVPNRDRDIMSYEDKCAASSVSCTLEPYYSNPNITVKGEAFGVAKGQTGAADGARWLNENRKIVAAFRATKVAAAPLAAAREPSADPR